MPPFAPVKYTLWLAFAGCITLCLVSAFSAVSLAAISVVTAALVYWLLRHRNQLRIAYATAESAAAVPGRYDKQIWGVKPRLKDVAPGIALLGLGSFYFAYEIVQGKAPTRIAKLAFEVFGIPGAVAFWVLLGTFLLAKGIESMLGSRVKSET